MTPHRKKTCSHSGEAHANAKLDWEKVAFIRKNPDMLTPSELAAKFNVSPTTISAVQQHITWNK